MYTETGRVGGEEGERIEPSLYTVCVYIYIVYIWIL